jgi:hypothetical protein
MEAGEEIGAIEAGEVIGTTIEAGEAIGTTEATEDGTGDAKDIGQDPAPGK